MKTLLLILCLIFALVLCGNKQRKCIQRTDELSCKTYKEIYNYLDDYYRSFRPTPEQCKDNPTLALQAGKKVGGIVRLAFHDSAEFSKKSKDHLRADGCVNLHDPGNAGLDHVIEEVNNLWIPFCHKISRADFWILAAKVAIEGSVPYIDFENTLGFTAEVEMDKSKKNKYDSDEITYYNIPFYYGRESVDNCSYSGPSRLPGAESSSKEYERVFFRNLGLSVRDTVALIGAHTVGSLTTQQSGYNGKWKGRTDIFDTQFYHNLMTLKWEPQMLMSPNKEIINQWIVHHPEDLEDAGYAMLNTDMELLYSIDPHESRTTKQSCGPYDVNAKTDGCPHTNDQHDYNFNYFVEKYFEGHAKNENDLPGSARWLNDFARAFAKLTSNGYTRYELNCADCPTRACPKDKCGHKELCEGPSYGHFEEPSK